MKNLDLESLLDHAQTAITGMQAAEIEESATQLTASIGAARHLNVTRLRLLRALALQSAQLWYMYLPENAKAVAYSSHGFIDMPSRGMEVSVTG